MSNHGRSVSVIKDGGLFAGLTFDQPGEQFDLRNLVYPRHPGAAGGTEVVVRTADGQLHKIGLQSGKPGRLFRSPRHGFPVECADAVLVVDKASDALGTEAPIREIIAHSSRQATAPSEMSGVFMEWQLDEGHPRLEWNTSSNGIPVDVAIPGKPRAHGLGVVLTKDDQFAKVREVAVPGARTYITTNSGNHYLLQAGANQVATLVDLRTIDQLGESKGIPLGGAAADGVVVVGKSFQYSAGNTSRVREILVIAGVTADRNAVLEYGALMNLTSPAVQSIHAAIGAQSLGASRP